MKIKINYTETITSTKPIIVEIPDEALFNGSDANGGDIFQSAIDWIHENMGISQLESDFNANFVYQTDVDIIELPIKN